MFSADMPLFAAEYHYFRAARVDWEPMLARMRQLGANAIATYVPWAWHELEPGVFDFDGRSEPCRDLLGFVECCALLGFRVILKPGPFCDAELLGGGIPPHLLVRHPEIAALRPDGVPWRHSDSGVARPCLLHPTYLAAAHAWLSAFSQAMLPYQAPTGPIIALQAENETPGDGMLPADIGLDPRFRLDYNPYVIDELWPAWCADHDLDVPAPRAWHPPTNAAEVHSYALLNAFTDQLYARGVAQVADALRVAGWTVPIFHDLLAMPWEAAGLLVDIGAMARATDWLGHNVYPEDVREPFVGREWYRYSFEEYVHFAIWRPRLMAQLSPAFPSFIPEISCAQDFFFAAPFVGGSRGCCVYMVAQSSPDEPRVGAFARWAMEAPIRPDASVRPRFWNARGLFLLLGMAGGDYAAAAECPTLALGYSHVPEHLAAWQYRFDYPQAGPAWQPDDPLLRALLAGADHGVRSQQLAQQLVRAGVDFAVVDLDAADPAELARYALVLVPATPVLARATQQRLAAAHNVVVAGAEPTTHDERLQPCAVLQAAEATGQVLRLPSADPAALVAALVERGGVPALIASGNEAVDVSCRIGTAWRYVFAANRMPVTFDGTLRGASGGDIALRLGPRRVAALVLDGARLRGAACGGDAGEGGWSVTCGATALAFSGGAGVVACDGAWLVCSAPGGGQFRITGIAADGALQAYRLLMHGRVLEWPSYRDGATLVVGYTADDESGTTDAVWLAPPDAPLTAFLREYLVTLLLARATALQHALTVLEHAPAAGALLPDEAHGALRQALDAMRDSAVQVQAAAADADLTLPAYATVWQSADDADDVALGRIAALLTWVRRSVAAAQLTGASAATLEHWLVSVLERMARSSLRGDRE